MSFESFNFIEHFNYLKNYIPQPFLIVPDSIKNITKSEDDYFLNTTQFSYVLTSAVIKKIVSALGIKIKLLETAADEANVFDVILPIVNKLFKCYSDCFVFYTAADDPLTIIDINVNNMHGEEGTKYEYGPSPWKFDINKMPEAFTCFVDFLNKYMIDQSDRDIQVVAEDIMVNTSKVNMKLFKFVNDTELQPMLSFSSKFSNMKGFTDIQPMIYDHTRDITVVFPMNYSKNESCSFDDMWNKLIHMYETLNLNEYIFDEINELAVSDEAPNDIKSFISDILINSTLNINQPIKNIIDECNNIASTMKAGKAKALKSNLGKLIGWCLLMKHSSCANCHHLHID